MTIIASQLEIKQRFGTGDPKKLIGCLFSFAVKNRFRVSVKIVKAEILPNDTNDIELVVE